MKALTVRQPWAWAIALGFKRVENRTWGTRYRGPLAIHAGKFVSVRGLNSPLLGADALGLPWRDATTDAICGIAPWPSYQLGVVMAVVELVDCHVAQLDDDGEGCCGDRYAEFEVYSDDERDTGREVWHWVLADVQLLDEPVLCRGSLQLWTVPADVDDAVAAQLAAAA